MSYRLTSPTCRRVREGEEIRVGGLNRALHGVTGTTCCAYLLRLRPRSSTSGRPATRSCRNLPGAVARRFRSKPAQSKLDCSTLRELSGKQILLGTIDLSDMNVEQPETVARGFGGRFPIRRPRTIVVRTDCGMKYLRAEAAEGKLRALVAGAAIVRRELGGAEVL